MNTGSVFEAPLPRFLGILWAWHRKPKLPGFVVIKDTSAMVVNGTRCWGNGFMPATHQGVLLENGPEPIANLKPRASKIEQAEDMKLSFLQSLNQSTSKVVNPTANWRPASAVMNWPPRCRCTPPNRST